MDSPGPGHRAHGERLAQSTGGHLHCRAEHARDRYPCLALEAGNVSAAACEPGMPGSVESGGIRGASRVDILLSPCRSSGRHLKDLNRVVQLDRAQLSGLTGRLLRLPIRWIQTGRE